MASNHNVVETSVVHTSRSNDDRNNVHAFINQYQIICLLGEGMHGRVMLAQNKDNRERVAIKSMRRNDPHNRRLPKSNRPGTAVSAQQETESKIRREIAVMKKCTHQNLVQLREVIDDPDSKKIYLVMENLAGGEVLWRNKDGPVAPVLALSQVQRIMRDVTLGLEYLHHQGIIHRDIKPANLLWTADRQSVKICDFGVSHFSLATAQDGAGYDEVGLSRTAGSPAFFAPEVCNFVNDSLLPPSNSLDLPPITKQIDIWALGVTFYCLLFGTPPWQGRNEFAMFRSICADDFIVPDTMGSEGLPTGGRDHSPEGEGLGWCIVDLLNGLLEKDQSKRITLAAIKRIPWIHTGVSDPERWLRETAPETQTLVTITPQDTKNAVMKAWRSNMRLKLFKEKIRKSITNFSRSRSTNRKQENAIAGPSTNGASTERTHSVQDRKLKSFKFGGPSPSRANTIPKDHRRSKETHALAQDSISRRTETRSVPTSKTSGGFTRVSSTNRRPCDSLRAPVSHSNNRNFFGASSSSTSPATSPTTPYEENQGGLGFRSRFSALLRQKSGKIGSKTRGHSSRNRGDDSATRGRGSAETLDVPWSTESSGLSSDHRAASWTYVGGSPDEDYLSSETDPTRSVVAFGAGGYVDRPSQYHEAGITHSDSSSNSTATNSTPQAHAPGHHVQRVRSPLSRGRAPYGQDDEDSDQELSSDAFDDTHNSADPDSSDEDDVLELRTRRPSTVLSRSANTSPLR